MKRILSSFFLLFFLIGCGSSSETKQEQPIDTKSSFTTDKTDISDPNKEDENEVAVQNTFPVNVTPQTVEESLTQVKNDAENIIPIEEGNTEKIVTAPQIPTDEEKSVTVYIHGYDDNGVNYATIYGYDAYDPMLDTLVKLTGFDTLQTFDPENFTNVITITPYYGQKAPSYYTQKDINDVEEVTQKYGGGIPRYAMIVAKYARHVMAYTGADHVNFISASMGSLVARWIIEKDIEHLASDKKILRWQTLEGVIRGNKLASSEDLVKYADSIQSQPVDVEHMSYQWIEKYLHSPRSEAASVYYHDIDIAQISSTKADKPFGWLMPKTPNDGYQALEDTYFKTVLPQARYHNQMPTHTLFYQTHLGLKNDFGAWANVATFLLPHKRVTITLTGAQVDDLHEHIYLLNKKAEIVFESIVYSPLVEKKWNITDAISERVYDSGALPVHTYKQEKSYKIFTQVLYDDYVLKNETKLVLKMAAYEIDQSVKYGVHDEFGTRSSLGGQSIELDLKNGSSYTITARDWSGTINVRVIEN